jgi:predicted CoA-substrate-specific enzyme activase
MLAGGIDIGSLSTDVVIVSGDRQIVSYAVVPTGARCQQAAEQALGLALERAGCRQEDLTMVISTGYGRGIVNGAHKQVTEITCHAKGAHFLFPETRTVIDIGGQDSKVIKVNPDGGVGDFAMNDKCAAGTGRFLEVMARTMQLELGDMGPRSLESTQFVQVSSLCTVFAESEVVSLIAQGRSVEDILNGLHHAIADRVSSLVRRVGREAEITMTGGVAKNVGVVTALERKLETKFQISEEPQIVGALGGAILALEHAERRARGNGKSEAA